MDHTNNYSVRESNPQHITRHPANSRRANREATIKVRPIILLYSSKYLDKNKDQNV